MKFTGDEIRAARERAHLTQQELGQAVGVSLRTIGNWERGESVPRSRMAALEEVLGLSDPALERAVRPEGGIQNLILDLKGSRSYARLSRDCGGDPSTNRLQAMATMKMNNFPEPSTIRGLSRGLNVSVSRVIMACAKSVGLNVEAGPADELILQGAGSLPPDAKELLVGMSRQLVQAHTVLSQDDVDLAARPGVEGVDPEDEQP